MDLKMTDEQNGGSEKGTGEMEMTGLCLERAWRRLEEAMVRWDLLII